MPTGSVVLIDGLGFGHANVVVAVPQAWIDVRSMADLDDVATAFRLKHERKMRRRHQIRESHARLLRRARRHRLPHRGKLRRDRGAPAAGTAELIVDITTTGATLAANGLKVIEDGVILRSQANLVAARAANWDAARARDRAASCSTASPRRSAPRAFREVRTRFAGCDDALLAEAQRALRRRGAVRRPDLLRACSRCTARPKHVHALATPVARKGRRERRGGGARLCVLARQSALRQARGGTLVASG